VDPDVLAVIVTGSQGAGAYDTERSDVDLRVVTVEGAEARWSTAHGSPVEAWAMSLPAFREHARPGSATAWDRPTFLHVRVDLDRTGGEIAALIEAKARLAPLEARERSRDALGDYLNSLVRALRNLEAGRELEGRLDAIETIGPLLTLVFALEGRVRPYNKWLRHELATRPLVGWDPLPSIDRLSVASTPTDLRAVFRVVEPLVRAAGLDEVVDGWAPELPWLRGGDRA
jgi:hypothetical protein